MFTLGGLTLLLWCVRFFAFRFSESPRYLIGRGLDEEAVKVIHKIAKFNGGADRCTLTVEDLKKVDPSPTIPAAPGVVDAERKNGLSSSGFHFSGSHIKPLFATKKMAWSTSLLIVIWGTIGLASTLYNSFLPFMSVIPHAFTALS